MNNDKTILPPIRISKINPAHLVNLIKIVVQKKTKTLKKKMYLSRNFKLVEDMSTLTIEYGIRSEIISKLFEFFSKIAGAKVKRTYTAPTPPKTLRTICPQRRTG